MEMEIQGEPANPDLRRKRRHNMSNQERLSPWTHYTLTQLPNVEPPPMLNTSHVKLSQVG